MEMKQKKFDMEQKKFAMEMEQKKFDMEQKKFDMEMEQKKFAMEKQKFEMDMQRLEMAQKMEQMKLNNQQQTNSVQTYEKPTHKIKNKGKIHLQFDQKNAIIFDEEEVANMTSETLDFYDKLNTCGPMT